MKIRRALISVWDKSGIVEFARALHDEFGIEIISTGGTAKTLREAGIPVILIEDITGFPELLDGRVKTLHPKIHAAILADRDNPEHMRQLAQHGIQPIDMVVVNLYPFENTVADPKCTFERAIEMIDIGGVTLLRAAAKNLRHVVTIDDPGKYEFELKMLRAPEQYTQSLESFQLDAKRVFSGTAQYDAHITQWLADQAGFWPKDDALWLSNWGPLRYGENPHQTAELIDHCLRPGLHLTTGVSPDDRDVQVELSFNNYVDADAALGLCAEITRAGQGNKPPLESDTRNPTSSKSTNTCVFIKHTNACGVGIASDPLEAYRRAYLGDPNAALGGILACDFGVNAEFAAAVMETYDRLGKPLKEAGASSAPGGFFVEVWVAPSFDNEAVKIIRTRKKWGENVRLLAVGDMTVTPHPDELQYRSIAGGLVVQTRDMPGLNEEQWKVVTKRAPSEAEMADLRLAWLVCKHTKSNAISICKDGMLIGNGAGQMSRVMSCRIATWLAKENRHADKLAGSAAASDAFFPFRDGPDILIDAGVTAIIQPGGSKRDADTIAACDDRGVAMIFSGTRHFRH